MLRPIPPPPPPILFDQSLNSGTFRFYLNTSNKEYIKQISPGSTNQ